MALFFSIALGMTQGAADSGRPAVAGQLSGMDGASAFGAPTPVGTGGA